jgi:tetratricopeptide (TPR) repeat protein
LRPRAARRWLRIALAAFAVLLPLAAGSAGAQPGGGTGPAQARALYEQGLKHYNLAEYDQAIDLFKQAYLQSEAPELLYNIAQSYRLKGAGHCRAAVRFYRSYLAAAPDSPKRPSVEAAIADTEACARAEAPPAAAPAPRPRPPASPAPPTSPPAETRDDEAPVRWLPIVVGGTGVVLALTGAATLTWARGRYHALEDRGCAPYCDPADVDGPRTGQRVGVILLAAGAAAGATGLVLWLVGPAPAHQQAWIVPNGRGVEVGLTF